jgi:nucleoside-diphosphate-sugar epimerase
VDLTTVGYSSDQCDLLDGSQVAVALLGCNRETSIVLCSAIPRRREDSWGALLKNIEMVHNVCTSVPSAGVRSVVFMSSMDVYGIHFGPGAITEESDVNPRGYYGLSNLTSEMALTIELPSHSPTCILRLPGIYGRGDRGEDLVGGFVQTLLHGEPVKMTGEGAAKRD